MAFFQKTDTKTKKQLERLRYLEREYPRLQKKVRVLEEKNTAQSTILKEQATLIEQLRLQIEELQKMIFRSKRKPPAPPPLQDGGNESEQNKHD